MQTLRHNIELLLHGQNVEQTNTYFNDIINYPSTAFDVFNLLNEVENSDENQILSKQLYFLIKNTVRRSWFKFTPDMKNDFFLLVSQHFLKISEFVEIIADIYKVAITYENEFRSMYENILSELYNRCSSVDNIDLSIIYQYIRVIYFILKKSPDKSSSYEISYILQRTEFTLIPILSMPDILGHRSGCDVIKYILKISVCLLKRATYNEETGLIYFNIVQNYINLFLDDCQFVNLSLITYCFNFLRSLMEQQYSVEFSTLNENIYNLTRNILVHAAGKIHDQSYLVRAILLLLCEFSNKIPEDIDLIQSLIMLCRIKQNDIIDLRDNIQVFHDNVYSLILNKDSYQSDYSHIQLPMLLLNILIKKYRSVALEVIQSYSSEVYVRIIADSAGTYGKKYKMGDDLAIIVQTILPHIGSDEVLTTSIVYLISACLEYFDKDTISKLVQLIPKLISLDNTLISISTLDLISSFLRKKVQLPNDLVHYVICLLDSTPTNGALICLNNFAYFQPDSVMEYAATVSKPLISSIKSNIEKLKSGEDIDEDMFCHNLNLLSTMISGSGGSLINESVIELINDFLSCDDGDFFEELSELLISIFKYETDLSITCFNNLLQAISENQTCSGYVDVFCNPIKCFIVKFKDKISQTKCFPTLLTQLEKTEHAKSAIYQTLSWYVFFDHCHVQSSLLLAHNIIDKADDPQPLREALELITACVIPHNVELNLDYIKIAETVSKLPDISKSNKACIALLFLHAYNLGLQEEDIISKIMDILKHDKSKLNIEEEYDGEEDYDCDRVCSSQSFSSPFELLLKDFSRNISKSLTAEQINVIDSFINQ